MSERNGFNGGEVDLICDIMFGVYTNNILEDGTGFVAEPIVAALTALRTGRSVQDQRAIDTAAAVAMCEASAYSLGDYFELPSAPKERVLSGVN